MTNRRRDRSIRIQRQGSGWVAEGPGFYVWDDNPDEVVRTVRELQRGNHSVPPTRRMRIVQPEESSFAPSGASTEALDF